MKFPRHWAESLLVSMAMVLAGKGPSLAQEQMTGRIPQHRGLTNTTQHTAPQ